MESEANSGQLMSTLSYIIEHPVEKLIGMRKESNIFVSEVLWIKTAHIANKSLSNTMS